LACFSLHPGTVDTPLTKQFVAGHPSSSASETAPILFNVIENCNAEDSGNFFDQNGLPVPW